MFWLCSSLLSEITIAGSLVVYCSAYKQVLVDERVSLWSTDATILFVDFRETSQTITSTVVHFLRAVGLCTVCMMENGDARCTLFCSCPSKDCLVYELRMEFCTWMYAVKVMLLRLAGSYLAYFLLPWQWISLPQICAFFHHLWPVIFPFPGLLTSSNPYLPSPFQFNNLDTFSPSVL